MQTYICNDQPLKGSTKNIRVNEIPNVFVDLWGQLNGGREFAKYFFKVIEELTNLGQSTVGF